MINGITILNEEVYNKSSTGLHICCALLFITFVLVGIYIIIDSIRDRIYEKMLFLILIIPMCIITFFATISTPEHLNDTYTKYEVTISDDVSMKEFTDKYSIIEQRGDIYVIKEKEK